MVAITMTMAMKVIVMPVQDRYFVLKHSCIVIQLATEAYSHRSVTELAIFVQSCSSPIVPSSKDLNYF